MDALPSNDGDLSLPPGTSQSKDDLCSAVGSRAEDQDSSKRDAITESHVLSSTPILPASSEKASDDDSQRASEPSLERQHTSDLDKEVNQVMAGMIEQVVDQVSSEEATVKTPPKTLPTPPLESHEFEQDQETDLNSREPSTFPTSEVPTTASGDDDFGPAIEPASVSLSSGEAGLDLNQDVPLPSAQLPPPLGADDFDFESLVHQNQQLPEREAEEFQYQGNGESQFQIQEHHQDHEQRGGLEQEPNLPPQEPVDDPFDFSAFANTLEDTLTSQPQSQSHSQVPPGSSLSEPDFMSLINQPEPIAREPSPDPFDLAEFALPDDALADPPAPEAASAANTWGDDEFGPLGDYASGTAGVAAFAGDDVFSDHLGNTHPTDFSASLNLVASQHSTPTHLSLSSPPAGDSSKLTAGKAREGERYDLPSDLIVTKPRPRPKAHPGGSFQSPPPPMAFGGPMKPPGSSFVSPPAHIPNLVPPQGHHVSKRSEDIFGHMPEVDFSSPPHDPYAHLAQGNVVAQPHSSHAYQPMHPRHPPMGPPPVGPPPGPPAGFHPVPATQYLPQNIALSPPRVPFRQPPPMNPAPNPYALLYQSSQNPNSSIGTSQISPPRHPPPSGPPMRVSPEKPPAVSAGLPAPGASNFGFPPEKLALFPPVPSTQQSLEPPTQAQGPTVQSRYSPAPSIPRAPSVARYSPAPPVHPAIQRSSSSYAPRTSSPLVNSQKLDTVDEPENIGARPHLLGPSQPDLPDSRPNSSHYSGSGANSAALPPPPSLSLPPSGSVASNKTDSFSQQKAFLSVTENAKVHLPSRADFLEHQNYLLPSDASSGDPLQRWRGKPVFKWASDGTIITSFPSYVPRYGGTGHDTPQMKCVPGEIKIRSARDILPLPNHILKFPGPLRKGKKKEVISWLESFIDSTAQKQTDGSDRAEREKADELILLKVLTLLVQRDGNLSTVGSVAGGDADVFGIFNIDKGVTHSRPSTAQARSEMPVSVPPSAKPVSFFLSSVHNALLRGEVEKAVWEAVDERQWAHAMLISSSLNKELYRNVVLEFVRKEIQSNFPGNEPLSVFYETISGNWNDSVEELIPFSARAAKLSNSKVSTAELVSGLDKWQETLVMILRNRTQDDAKTILAMGNMLAANERIAAAHVCYLFCGPLACVSGIDDPASHLTILNRDPRAHGRSFDTDLEAILLTEVLEFAFSLRSQGPGHLPFLQPYKLHHAVFLEENNRRTEAQQYCDLLADNIQAKGKRSSYLSPDFLSRLEDLSKRVSKNSKDSSSWLTRSGVERTVWNTLATFVAGDDNESDAKDTPGAGIGNSGIGGPFSGRTGGMAPPPSLSRNPSISNFSSATGEVPPPPSLNHLTPYSVKSMPMLPVGYQSGLPASVANGHLSDMGSTYAPSMYSVDHNLGTSNMPPSQQNSPARPPPTRRGIMDDDDDDDLSARAAALQSQKKDEDKKEGTNQSAKPKSSWFGGWFKRAEDSHVHKGNLGEPGKLVYDKELKKWVKEGTKTPISNAQAAAIPPPPKGMGGIKPSTPRPSTAAGSLPSAPPKRPASNPSHMMAAPHFVSAPSSMAGSSLPKADLAGSDAPAPQPPSPAESAPAPSAPPPGFHPPRRPATTGPTTGPPPRSENDLSSLLMRPPTTGPTGRKKGRGGGRYVDVLGAP